MKEKKVIIISHRRSGTHLTIDVIRENFFGGTEYLNIDSFIDIDNKTFDFKSFEREAANINVFKTHIIPDFSQYISDSKSHKYLIDFFNSNFKIYISRDGKDVMVSLFHYMKKFDKSIQDMSFSNFLKTINTFDPYPENLSRVKFWNYHVTAWRKEKNILFLTYEDLIFNYEQLLNKISNHLGLPLKKIVDLRLKSTSVLERYINIILIKFKLNKKNSAVGFRKGKTNDYINYFNPSDYEFYKSEINEDPSYK